VRLAQEHCTIASFSVHLHFYPHETFFSFSEVILSFQNHEINQYVLFFNYKIEDGYAMCEFTFFLMQCVNLLFFLKFIYAYGCTVHSWIFQRLKIQREDRKRIQVLQLNEDINTKHLHIYLHKHVFINICILHIYIYICLCVFCNLFIIDIL